MLKLEINQISVQTSNLMKNNISSTPTDYVSKPIFKVFLIFKSIIIKFKLELPSKTIIRELLWFGKTFFRFPELKIALVNKMFG
jgi:hypothetical protein